MCLSQKNLLLFFLSTVFGRAKCSWKQHWVYFSWTMPYYIAHMHEIAFLFLAPHLPFFSPPSSSTFHLSGEILNERRKTGADIW